MVCVFLADGFEEIEAVTAVDILRRGGVNVKTVGCGSQVITGSHGIKIVCDMTDLQVEEKEVTGCVIPGGKAGVLKLIENETVKKLVRICLEGGLVTGAVCAGPLLLNSMGLLRGRHILCYPTLEKEMVGAIIEDGAVSIDLNLITGRGPGASQEFAYALLEALSSRKRADEVRRDIEAGLR